MMKEKALTNVRLCIGASILPSAIFVNVWLAAFSGGQWFSSSAYRTGIGYPKPVHPAAPTAPPTIRPLPGLFFL
jgi:hypothetical protein